ncbi:MAG: hypothetical protein WKF73_22120 [Nocardioidaceae bacterium]
MNSALKPSIVVVATALAFDFTHGVHATIAVDSGHRAVGWSLAAVSFALVATGALLGVYALLAA